AGGDAALHLFEVRQQRREGGRLAAVGREGQQAARRLQAAPAVVAVASGKVGERLALGEAQFAGDVIAVAGAVQVPRERQRRGQRLVAAELKRPEAEAARLRPQLAVERDGDVGGLGGEGLGGQAEAGKAQGE